MLAGSAKALFTGLIDYAGLFPPAALSMADAVRNYDVYRRGEHAWMLGRFIVPAAKMNEVPGDFPLSVLGVAGGQARAPVSPLEVKEIGDFPDDQIVYVETADLDLIDDIAERGLRAKIRTGGVTPDAFPDAAFIAAFIERCAERGVAFKATAGLHHPIRCIKPLTYEANAPTGTMHGFVNVFMAAALLRQAQAILMETDALAFEFGDDAASWRGHSVRTEDLRRIRKEFAISFGSCSFEEPVADLKELGWL
jgi:hypothetical protein